MNYAFCIVHYQTTFINYMCYYGKGGCILMEWGSSLR